MLLRSKLLLDEWYGTNYAEPGILQAGCEEENWTAHPIMIPHK